MSTEKVSWQYKNGVKSFINLWNMIETALESLQEEGLFNNFTIKITKSHGGFYLDDDFWTGIQLDDPEKIFFGYMNFAKNNEIFNDMIRLKDNEIPARVYDFNDNHFYELPRDEQQKGILNFLKECLEVVKI